MPAPGHIGRYHEPSGPGVRVDSGVEPDYTVPQAYDPMIAKLVSYGSNREEARRRMLRALAEYEVEGISTTIPFHRLMLADERFVSGDYHTGTVEKEMDLSPLKSVPKPKLKPGEQMVAEREFTVEVSGKRFQVKAREKLDTLVERTKPKPPKIGTAVGGSGENLTAPMQGSIVKVMVKKGDQVKVGDTVCVLEAMKMENSILSHADGTVEELKVEAGHTVETGAVIAVIR
jgi:acetyl-CoA/propionyl-CoA carboxylase biotin carboxyl carrier protein